MINNNHNSSCNFSDLLISYVYNEIGDQEKARFEAHILNCGACEAEISAFAGIRSSVLLWREQDFASLPNPIIDLPLNQEINVSSVSQTQNSRSWFAGWRDLFSLSPAWAGAATACAALAICAGLFYVAVSSQRSDDNIAGANKSVSVPSIPSPTVDNPKPSKTAELDPIKQPINAPKPENIKGGESVLPKSPWLSEKAVVSAPVNTNAKPIKVKDPAKSGNQEKPPVVKKAPKESEIEFSNRVEEDKSLRLADIFDEVSMK